VQEATEFELNSTNFNFCLEAGIPQASSAKQAVFLLVN
jgi:hypothetical protein